MREFNALAGYPEPKEPRYVAPTFRTIHHRIKATYRDKDLYDGDRASGYGGLKYDGRWLPIARNIYKEYGLRNGAKVLQVGCQKGFLLYDILQTDNTLQIAGTEVTEYPINHAPEEIKPYLTLCPFTSLPYPDHTFDLVIAIGVVYVHNLTDAIKSVREIQRVGKGKSFITLASYTTEEEFWLFQQWSLLAATVLKEDEWREVLKHSGYTGDYAFVSARSLNLAWEKES